MDMNRKIHIGFNRKEFSLMLDSGYIAFDTEENHYGGMWFTWLGFEFAFCSQLIDFGDIYSR